MIWGSIGGGGVGPRNANWSGLVWLVGCQITKGTVSFYCSRIVAPLSILTAPGNGSIYSVQQKWVLCELPNPRFGVLYQQMLSGRVACRVARLFRICGVGWSSKESFCALESSTFSFLRADLANDILNFSWCEYRNLAIKKPSFRSNRQVLLPVTIDCGLSYSSFLAALNTPLCANVVQRSNCGSGLLLQMDLDSLEHEPCLR